MRKEAKNNKKNSGFYLVETIIAMFLLIVGLLVTVNLISNVMSNTFVDRDNAISVLLAQEGLELMRNLRDNNWASGKRAFANFPNFTPNGDFDPTQQKNDCGLDMNSDLAFISSNCVLPGNTPTRGGMTLSGNFYILDAVGVAKKYNRGIAFEYNISNSTLTIWSVVVWDGPNWPPGNIETECTASRKCAWSKATLSEWGD